MSGQVRVAHTLGALEVTNDWAAHGLEDGLFQIEVWDHLGRHFARVVSGPPQRDRLREERQDTAGELE